MYYDTETIIGHNIHLQKHTSNLHSNDEASNRPNKLSGVALCTRLQSYSSNVASISLRSTVKCIAW